MLRDTSRRLVFLALCVPARCTLAYAALSLTGVWARLLALACAAIAVGFAVLYLFGLRPTGIEAGGRIWWDSLRPLHALTFGAAAALLWVGSIHNSVDLRPAAAVVLALDVALGIGASVAHHDGTRLK